MKIGLIDVDGHNFPNLALTRISAWHKSQGDDVEWYFGFGHYDVVYLSKIFSDTYTKAVFEPTNADLVVKGGTGYAISLVDGKEVYDKTKDTNLPDYIEKMRPDYSIYPQYDFAVAMTSRGCPRGCHFSRYSALIRTSPPAKTSGICSSRTKKPGQGYCLVRDWISDSQKMTTSTTLTR